MHRHLPVVEARRVTAEILKEQNEPGIRFPFQLDVLLRHVEGGTECLLQLICSGSDWRLVSDTPERPPHLSTRVTSGMIVPP
jgi:hypothetical protein